MTFISANMTPAERIRRKNRDFSTEKIVFTVDEQGNPVHEDHHIDGPQADPRGGYYPYKFDGGVKGMTWPGMLLDMRV